MEYVAQFLISFCGQLLNFQFWFEDDAKGGMENIMLYLFGL